MNLSTPVQFIKGIGPKTAQRFSRLGVETAADLLSFYPRDYVDYSQPYSVASAPSAAAASAVSSSGSSSL